MTGEGVPEEVTTLAEAGAQAFVTAMASDAWPILKRRFARVLRTEERSLDDARDQQARLPDGERTEAATRYRTNTASRLAELMTQDPALVAELRALLAELGTAEAPAPVAVDQRITGSAVTNATAVGTNTGEINIGGRAGKIENRFSLTAPFVWLGGVVRAHPRIAASVMAVVLVGGGTGAVVTATRGGGHPGIFGLGLPSTPSSVSVSALAPSASAGAVGSASGDAPSGMPLDPAGTLQAVVCVNGEPHWSTIDVSGGGSRALTLFVPVPNALSCETSSLYDLSPNTRYWADSGSTVNGSMHAGYDVLAGPANLFVDVSGAEDTDFAARTVQDSAMMFDPVTGDEWWVRNGHLFSNTVPPGMPVDHGPGSLDTFTPQGDPMPYQTYDSPSGHTRLVLPSNPQYDESVVAGPTSVLDSACMQRAAGDNTAVVSACPGAAASTDDPCPASIGGENFAGFTDDSTIVCWSQSSDGSTESLQALTIGTSGENFQITGTRQITPATQQIIDDALVTPDGRTVLFFAGDSEGLHLYSAPTSGNGTAAPTLLEQWSRDTTIGFVGWRLPDGTLRQ